MSLIPLFKALARWVALVLTAALALQLFFVGRIALMAKVNPQSTTFERSEAWRITHERDGLRWRQQWADYDQISDNLKRAVIASEDDRFADHDGVNWEALEKARQRNTAAEERAAKQIALGARKVKPPKIVGGSTITQQLAKNLLLSGERTLLRKGQELVLTFLLERFLTKQRILELYLNHVEWGEGVFGAEAAAQHYFRKPASRLNGWEAARLAVMLPRPRVYEKLPNSPYLTDRAGVIVGRLSHAELP